MVAKVLRKMPLHTERWERQRNQDAKGRREYGSKARRRHPEPGEQRLPPPARQQHEECAEPSTRCGPGRQQMETDPCRPARGDETLIASAAEGETPIRATQNTSNR